MPISEGAGKRSRPVQAQSRRPQALPRLRFPRQEAQQAEANGSLFLSPSASAGVCFNFKATLRRRFRLAALMHRYTEDIGQHRFHEPAYFWMENDLKKALASWGRGKYDAELLHD